MKRHSTTKQTAQRERRRGFVSTTVLILTAVAIVVLLALVSATSTQLKLSARGQDRVTGAALAEAGIDDAIDKIRLNPDSFIGTRHTAFPDITLYEDHGTNLKPQGSFQTDVRYVDETTRRVISTGTNANGTTVTIAALVTIEMSPIGNGAILANGDAKVAGDAFVATVPSNEHVANVISNGDIVMMGGSYVDGCLVASGTISGSAFIPSKPDSEPYPFPSVALTNKWKTDAIAETSRGTIYNSVRTSKIITAPAYIKGDIILSSNDAVVLNGSGVVFVEGNVKLTAQSSLTSSVTLFVNGTFDQAGQSVYSVNTASVSYTPTLMVYGTNSSPTDDTVSLTGGSSGVHQGIVFAASGNIKLAGGSVFTGALMAGGEDAQVKATGGYTHGFPTGMSSTYLYPSGAHVETMAEF